MIFSQPVCHLSHKACYCQRVWLFNIFKKGDSLCIVELMFFELTNNAIVFINTQPPSLSLSALLKFEPAHIMLFENRNRNNIQDAHALACVRCCEDSSEPLFHCHGQPEGLRAG